VARCRLENQLAELIFPLKTNAANERLALHLWNHRDELFTFLRQPGLDATNWRAELAIRSYTPRGAKEFMCAAPPRAGGGLAAGGRADKAAPVRRDLVRSPPQGM
jgi:hypothetical protein